MSVGRCVLLGLLALWCFDPAGGAAPLRSFTAEVETVVDGDSLEVRRGGDLVQVRLFGIDCPEWQQPHGREAARATAALAAGRTVTVLVRGTDDYGRLLAEVQLPDGRSLNRELVNAGHAWWYRRYSDDAELERLESEARNAARGLWRNPAAVPPWRWRHARPR